MLNGILVFLGAAIAALLAYAATRPDTFRVERTARIDAPPERIFPWIEDLRANERWSPYYRKDPAARFAYGGPVRGVGASCTFEGNRDVGSGRVTVTGSTPHRRVRMRLQMFKPFAADNDVEYTLVPQGEERTDVTWAMTGTQPFLAKVVGLFFDMDAMIGTDFASGLANLKALVEGRAPDLVPDAAATTAATLGTPHAT
ncbi:MAG TPA: SRPBCC family protein [Steroidobacteraceae bacterium]|nr:SRPBCC family protein [Steroidobacteraceae bacterium]